MIGPDLFLYFFAVYSSAVVLPGSLSTGSLLGIWVYSLFSSTFPPYFFHRLPECLYLESNGFVPELDSSSHLHRHSQQFVPTASLVDAVEQAVEPTQWIAPSSCLGPVLAVLFPSVVVSFATPSHWVRNFPVWVHRLFAIPAEAISPEGVPSSLTGCSNFVPAMAV